MKFAGIILRIKSFWTAFALSLIFVAVLSDAAIFKGFNACRWTESTESQRAQTPRKLAAPEDYAVFSAVMQQRLSFRQTYVVGDTAFDETPADALQNGMDFQVSGETLTDYIAKNSEATLLENRFKPQNDRFNPKFEFSLVLLKSEEDDFLSKNNADWDKFYETYPGSGGIVYFSNVGFNAEKTEALVRIKYLCALCSGKETFYFLNKSGEQWRVQ